jgi:protein-tyrosine phosphatase
MKKTNGRKVYASPETTLTIQRGNSLDEEALSDYTFNNFTAIDLLTSTDSHTKATFYNDKEKQIIKERKTAKRSTPGRSIDSIRRNPNRGTLDSIIAMSNTTLSALTEMNSITDNIYLGSKKDAGDIALLKKHGISHILNVAAQLPNYFPAHFICLKVPLLDSIDANVTDCMNNVCKFLCHVEAVGGRVLIHCISGTIKFSLQKALLMTLFYLIIIPTPGVSRSVIVLLMHLIVSHRIPLRDAYNYVRSCR